MESKSEQLAYEDLERIAGFIRGEITVQPLVGVICGSGLGGLADLIDGDKKTLHYDKIPNFPRCNVKGHAGELVFGYLSGLPTVCMKGRFHFYEGHPPWRVTMPVRVMKLLGVKILIVTNAAGGLNTGYKNGDIMLIKDHINLVGMTGHHPLVGENEERFGERFHSMSTAYDGDLRKLMRTTASELAMGEYFREGVYVYLSGPNYETPAEARFLRMVGADAVGMSTVPEVIVARHCGIRVLGLSLVTNEVIQDNDSEKPEPNHKEVMEMADQRAKDMQKLVTSFLLKVKEGNSL
ncbi:hypothetical protein EMCRGX_G031888 [Ephydatia muelleri]